MLDISGEFSLADVTEGRTVTVTVERASGVAPDAPIIKVDVTGSTVPEAKRLIWIDYGDSSPATAITTARTGFSQFTTYTKSMGDLGGHLYEGAGTYTITATLYEDGMPAVSGSTTHTVAAELDEAYDQVYVVATDGVYTGAPSFPNATTVTNTTSIDTAITGGSASDYTYIALKRGQTFGTIDTAMGGVNSFETRTNVTIGAWGSGADPIINGRIENSGNAAIIQLKIQDCDVKEAWDVSTETGTLSEKAQILLIGDGVAQSSTTVCQFIRGSLRENNSGIETQLVPMTIAHSTVVDNRDFGILGGGDTAVFGCDMNRSADALGGGSQATVPTWTSKDGNAHGPIRVSGGIDEGDPEALSPILCYVGQNQLSNFYGWSGGVNPDHQPPIRLGTGGVSRNDRYRVYHNICEGGFASIEMKQANKLTLDDYMNCHVIGNLFYNSGNLDHYFIETDRGGMSFYNNVFVGWDVPRESAAGNNLGAVFGYVSGTRPTPSAVQVSQPIEFDSNTIVVLRSYANGINPSVPSFGIDTSNVAAGTISSLGITINSANNVIHVPDQSGHPSVGSVTNVDLGTNGRYLGLYHATQALDATYASTGEDMVIPHVNASSTSGYQDATSSIYFDMLGRIRPSAASRGAYDPGATAV